MTTQKILMTRELLQDLIESPEMFLEYQRTSCSVLGETREYTVRVYNETFAEQLKDMQPDENCIFDFQSIENRMDGTKSHQFVYRFYYAK